ncbi:MAG: hypothetical protein H6779_04245 [Candidatus Nomurabacteria bacterium]|nr:MAG: hypothetical protein H6779_04245 [Candidatus Nomurabacteria bacterium]
MHQGNWKCSTCGGPITELPFVPRSESGLTCRTCYAKQKSKDKDQRAPEISETPNISEPPPHDDIPDYAEVATEPPPHEDFAPDMVPASSERPRFSGEWECAGCGAIITSLPFNPRDTSNLKCLDCFKKSKSG